MNAETFRLYCLSKPHTSEAFPFDENTLVFRVGSKIFALCDISGFESVNLKCDPDRAVALREACDAITPGYHMNKRHWNTVRVDGSISESLFLELVDHSYELVWKSLTKAERTKLTG